MKSQVLPFAVLALAMVSFSQTEPAVCPKHIEAPIYPAIARTAHIQGKVVVQVTIDADGTVSDAEVTNDDSPKVVVRLFGPSSLANAKTWTFSKQPRGPYQLTIAYDYRIDNHLPSDVTRVAFDLPTHVSITGGPPVLNTSDSRAKKN